MSLPTVTSVTTRKVLSKMWKVPLWKVAKPNLSKHFPAIPIGYFHGKASTVSSGPVYTSAWPQPQCNLEKWEQMKMLQQQNNHHTVLRKGTWEDQSLRAFAEMNRSSHPPLDARQVAVAPSNSGSGICNAYNLSSWVRREQWEPSPYIHKEPRVSVHGFNLSWAEASEEAERQSLQTAWKLTTSISPKQEVVRQIKPLVSYCVAFDRLVLLIKKVSGIFSDYSFDNLQGI